MALKTVTGKLTDAAGNAVAYPKVKATLSAPAVIANTQEIAPGTISVVGAADGTWSLSAQSNLDLIPSTTSYLWEVGSTWSATVVVPSSAGPFTVESIMAAPPAVSPPAALDSAVVHLANPETITGVKGGAFRDWGGGMWDVHSSANPSFSVLGTADETLAWNAAVVAANAAGGGIVRGLPGYTYKLKRKQVGQQNGGGISLLAGVSLLGYGVTLEMDDNTQHITNPLPDTATVATVTANVTTGDTNFTVDSSAGFVVGDEVFCRFGQNPYDSAESIFWMWAKVLTIPDGAHLTLDRPCMVTFTAGSTATVSKQITKTSGAVANAFIAGFNFTQGSGGNVEQAIFLRKVRNFDLIDLKATDPGAGIMCWYSHNITGRNYWCPHSVKQGGQASKGRVINIAACVNVDWENIRAENFENNVTFVESFSRNIKFKNVFVNNNNPSRVANTGLFFVGQGSECYHENVEVEGSGTNTTLVDSGGTPNITRFRNLTVDVAPNLVAGATLADVEGVLRIKSQPSGIAGDYTQIRRYSKVFSLLPSASGLVFSLPSGLYRRLRIFVNSTTGLNNVYLINTSGQNPDLLGSLVAGQLVDVTSAALIATWGTNSYSNGGTTGRSITLYSGATVPANAYMVVELDYWESATDDGTQGYLEDPTTSPKSQFFPVGLASQAVEPSTGSLSPHVIPSVPSLAGETWAPYPNGVDDTTALDNLYTAWASGAQKTKLKLWYGTYRYNGTGFSGGDFNVEGMGYAATTVLLGASSYFIKSASYINTLDLKGILFSQGLGAIYFTYTPINVSNYHFNVDRCWFQDYTQTAIGYTSSDMPYWKVSRSIFRAATSTSAIGLAFAGYTDQSSIVDCSFLRNKVHIKAGLGGNNLLIRNCDLLQSGGGSSRIAVWVVPNPSQTNAGAGLLIDGSKFGSENQDASDYRLVYADEAAGTDFTTKLPNLGADSTGFISEHVVRDCRISGAFAIPIVYSTTPNIYPSRYTELDIDGSAPSYVIQYRTVPLAADRLNSRSIFGPFNWESGSEVVPIPISNAAGVGYVIDPSGVLSANTDQPHHLPGMSDGIEYSVIANTAIPSFSLGGATLVGATDSLGGSDASTATIPNGSYLYEATPGTTIGLPLYIEFELKSGGATPLTSVNVELWDGASTFHFRRVIPVPTNWRRFRFMMTPRATSVANLVFVNRTGSSGTVLIGRAIVYHAREPFSKVHSQGGIFYKALIPKRVVLAYSATIATDASLGNEFDITATNGTAFTISNPTNLADGQQVTYTIRNTSGGALGVITWGAIFKLPAWTSPATAFSRSITFRHDGTNLVMLHRSDADVPN